jgi:hypothetical protein
VRAESRDGNTLTRRLDCEIESVFSRLPSDRGAPLFNLSQREVEGERSPSHDSQREVEGERSPSHAKSRPAVGQLKEKGHSAG